MRGSTHERVRSRSTLLGAAIVVLATVPPLRGLWRTQGAPMEEGFMLTFPEMVLEGSIPNRDFLHLYGPGSLWVLAAVFAIAGVSLAAERSVGFLQHLGVALALHRLLRPWGPWVATGGASLGAMMIITPSGLAAMAWVGGLAFALWSLSSAVEACDAEAGSTRRRRHALLAGLLAGAALLYRLDLVLALGASGLVIALALDGGARRRLLGGFALGASPYLLHVMLAGPWATFNGLVLQPVFDLRAGRHLPVPPSPNRLDGFLQGAGALDQPPWPFPAPSGPRQLWLWFFALLAAALVLVVAGVLSHRRTSNPRLLAIAVFSAGLLPQALQRPDSTHLAWVSCVVFAVLPAALIELWRAAERGPAVGRPTLQLSLLSIGAPAMLLAVVAPFYTYRSYAEATAQSFGRRVTEGVIEHQGRRFPYKRQDAVQALNEMLPVVDALTRPGDRLIVGPGDLRLTPYSEAFLYHLLPDLTPGTRYIEMDPGIANAPNSGLADEVAAADVIILSTIRDDWNEPNDSRQPGSAVPQQILERDFCLAASFGVGPFDPRRGLYEVYLRCDARRGTRLDVAYQ